LLSPLWEMFQWQRLYELDPFASAKQNYDEALATLEDITRFCDEAIEWGAKKAFDHFMRISKAQKQVDAIPDPTIRDYLLRDAWALFERDYPTPAYRIALSRVIRQLRQRSQSTAYANNKLLSIAEREELAQWMNPFTRDANNADVHIMDIYLMGRLLRAYPTKDEEARNVIIYVGYFHARHYDEMLIACGFTREATEENEQQCLSTQGFEWPMFSKRIFTHSNVQGAVQRRLPKASHAEQVHRSAGRVKPKRANKT
jgi:hypothetical protein